LYSQNESLVYVVVLKIVVVFLKQINEKIPVKKLDFSHYSYSSTFKFKLFSEFFGHEKALPSFQVLSASASILCFLVPRTCAPFLAFASTFAPATRAAGQVRIDMVLRQFLLFPAPGMQVEENRAEITICWGCRTLMYLYLWFQEPEIIVVTGPHVPAFSCCAEGPDRGEERGKQGGHLQQDVLPILHAGMMASHHPLLILACLDFHPGQWPSVVL
jgi:hypothetical protein